MVRSAPPQPPSDFWFHSSRIPSSISGSGLAADSSGQLWSAPQGSFGTLYRVDPDSGIVDVATNLSGAGGGSINSMTYLRGVLYAVAADSGTLGTTELVTIDTETGELTRVGALPSGVDSLAAWPP